MNIISSVHNQNKKKKTTPVVIGNGNVYYYNFVDVSAGSGTTYYYKNLVNNLYGAVNSYSHLNTDLPTTPSSVYNSTNFNYLNSYGNSNGIPVIEHPNISLANNNFSTCFWFKGRQSPTGYTYYYFGNNNYIQINVGGFHMVLNGGLFFSTGGTITSIDWSHFSLTIDNLGNYILYKNGTQIRNGIIQSYVKPNLFDPSSTWSITLQGGDFIGPMAAFSKVLTAAEVQQIYNNQYSFTP